MCWTANEVMDEVMEWGDGVMGNEKLKRQVEGCPTDCKAIYDLPVLSPTSLSIRSFHFQDGKQMIGNPCVS